MSKDREKFKKNYTGIFHPDNAYEYEQAKKKNAQTYGDATYSKSANKKMEREANQADFNRLFRR